MHLDLGHTLALLGLFDHQAMVINALDIPGNFGQPAVQAGSVSRGSEFTVDGTHSFAFEHSDQAGRAPNRTIGWSVDQIARLQL